MVPVFCRASFGVRGANVPAILRALVACGWFGIQTWIGGLALNALLTAAWPAWGGIAGGIWISFAVFWLVQVAIIVRGLEGIKVLEAWAAGLPVVSSAVGGIPKVVEHGETGLLFESGDQPALVQALERVLGDEGLSARLAAAGQDAVQARYSLERMADDYGRIYAEAMARR